MKDPGAAHWKRLYLWKGGRSAVGIGWSPDHIAVHLTDPRDGSEKVQSFQILFGPEGTYGLMQDSRLQRGHAIRREDQIWVHLAGVTYRLGVETPDRPHRGSGPELDANEVRAPMTGTVRQLLVVAGNRVHRGQPLVLLEAMKMEHVLKAPREGWIAQVDCAVGQTVDVSKVLLHLTAAPGEDIGLSQEGTSVPREGE